MARSAWHPLALAAILALSAFLGFFRLSEEGFSNTYYAATVRSMLTGWHNFFFASYDPGGFVSVDKPPLGFWMQAASAKVFGFHGWSLLLPQVVAGVLSVALLYHLVRRSFGPVAGLLASLALAVTPITVATLRNNTVDGLLVLTLLLAAWALSRAAESGRLRPLLLTMGLVGLGFNIKMLEAYLVLPAFYAVYLLGAPLRWRARLAHLALATLVLLAVSLSWAVAVDLTPPEKRPYVGGSSDNTAMDLILGYNGLDRLFGLDGAGMSPAGQRQAQNAPHDAGGRPAENPPPDDGAGQGLQSAAQPQQSPPGGRQDTQQGGRGNGTPASTGGGEADGNAIASIGGENGAPGPLRFFNERLAGQISWLLPLAGLGLAVAGGQTLSGSGAGFGPARRVVEAFRRGPLGADSPGATRRRQALALWGTWLLTQVAFFSVAGFWHTYYLVVVAPAIAALAGAGALALWKGYRTGGRGGWLLPATLVGTAALQAWILADYPGWDRRLSPPIVVLCSLASAGLVVARLRPCAGSAIRPVLATVGVLALLIAPATWSVVTALSAPGEMLPRGGPSPEGEAPDDAAAGNLLGGGERADPRLIRYLLDNRRGERYLVATGYSGNASPIILSTGEPVMAMGGFGGADEILTTENLAELVSEGEVRFFLLSSPGPAGQVSAGAPGPTTGGQAIAPVGARDAPKDDLTDWVRSNCDPVPQEEWRSEPAGQGPEDAQTGGTGEALYDCGERAR